MIIKPEVIIEKKVLVNILNVFEQAQQNGIDVCVWSISKIDPNGLNVLTSNERTHADRVDVPFYQIDGMKNCSLLRPWEYDILFDEKINIPSWMCANIYTRSTINRGWNFITAGLYDAWYKWILWAILHINVPIILEKGVRVAQIVFSEAQEWKLYDWVYNKKSVV